MKPFAYSIKFVTYLLPFACLLFLAKPGLVKAQTVSYSVAPAIYELNILPGTSAELNYVFTNNGGSAAVQVNLYPFYPEDELGNPRLDEDIFAYDPLNTLPWFTLANPAIEFKQSFPMAANESKEITLAVNPSPNAIEGDYYFTLLFESSPNVDLIGESAAVSRAKIGTNLILTVGDESLFTKAAEIARFQAPLFLDSFFDLNFELIIKNTGSTFFKPIGGIEIKPLIGKTARLTLAPQNVLVRSTRQINCLQGERLVPCSYRPKFLFGLYRSTLNVNLDDYPHKLSATRSTIALPFSLIVPLILIILIYKRRPLRYRQRVDAA